MTQRNDEMSLRTIVETTGISDKIALLVSNEAMRKIGWSNSPELMLERFAFDHMARHTDSNELERVYEGIYSLHGARTPYITSVVILKADNWYGGFVTLRHPTTEVHFRFGFGVDWTDGSPTVTLSDKACVVG